MNRPSRHRPTIQEAMMAAALAPRDAHPSHRGPGHEPDSTVAWGASAWEAAPTGPLTLPPAPEDRPLADVIPLRPRTATTRRPAARYRRRRVVAALAVAVVALLTVVGLRATASTPTAPPSEPAPATVTLAPGDTLWDVAVAATAPGGDPRVTLAEIRELNGLDGDIVPAWTVVQLPTR